MLPKPVRSVYYWISHRGKIGFYLAQVINWIFAKTVRILGFRAWQDRTCLVIISHKYKFIYIGIPKTATRSFLNEFAIMGKETYNSEWHETSDALPRALKNYPDYYKFSFVRNPYARVVSCYNSKIHNAVPGKQARIMSFYRNLSPSMSFGDFASWLNTEEGGDAYADRHWLSQNVLLSDENGQNICDFIGRYEDLEAGLSHIKNHLKFSDPISLAQKGFVSPIRNYQSYYDEKSRSDIEKRYAEDLKRYGYEF
jgi:hypothetical protein